METLILKRASASRPDEWSEDDFDVLEDGAVVGRISKANAAPVGTPWMWTWLYPPYEGSSRVYGYAATREDAMGAFTKSWRRK